MNYFKELKVWQKAMNLVTEIYLSTQNFPKEETYSLTDQIRRSFRSVSAAIAEAYRKRNYPRHFASKLTDSDAENSETQVWLEYAFRCSYLPEVDYKLLLNESEEVGKLINYMILNPEKFGVKTKE